MLKNSILPIAAALIAITVCAGCGPSADTTAKPAATSDSGAVFTAPGAGGAAGAKPQKVQIDPSK